MMGWGGYAPEARGIRAALLCHLYAPANRAEQPDRLNLSGEALAETNHERACR